MDTPDVSSIILQITPANSDAISAFGHPQNEPFLVSSSTPIPRSKREGTPIVEHRAVSAALRTDHLPFDPALGYVFGREDEDNDFVLGTIDQGISLKQFSVNYNWEARTLVLKNLSGNGTTWTDPEMGQNEMIMTSRAIIGSMQHRVSAGVIDLILQIPPRDEKQQAKYDIDVERLRDGAEKATPMMSGLKVHSHGKITPMVVGRNRKFILGRVIGTGATAIVYEAYDHETGDQFAAKEYTFDGRTDAVLKAMQREISLLKKLKHKHIVQYVDIFRGPDPILIMERGIKSLEACKIANDSECVTLLTHVLHGLDYLHQEGVIHRDIKPANILLTKINPPEWKLTDFGHSKKSDQASTFLGSPMYLAPEVDGLPFSQYTKAVDIWSVGVVGVEYSCGFEAGSENLLTSRTKRRPWCQAVHERSKSSGLAAFLIPMLDMVPANRPSPIEMQLRLKASGLNDDHDKGSIPAPLPKDGKETNVSEQAR